MKNHRKQKINVAIVEDNPIDLELMQACLSENDYNILTYSKGKDFLEDPILDMVDLVLLDVMLPDMNGHEILKEVRKMYSQIEMPVLFVTLKDNPNEILEGFSYGANDYITKPFESEILRARVETQAQIVYLMKKSLELKEYETLNAMVTTYNHELNNPLMIGMGAVSSLNSSDPTVVRLQMVFERMVKITKKIANLRCGEMEYSDYSDRDKVLILRSG